MEIERLNNIGDGCGFFNKKKVFIQKSCVGDVVKFTKVKETKDYIIGNITEIVKKSNCRVEKIICPFYDKCGGCNLLHLKEEEYSNFKKNILKDTIKKSGHDLKKIELIYIGFNSRRRVVFKVKNNKIGFFEKQSNNLTEINNCLLIENEINSVIPQLKEIIKKILVDEIFVTKYENGLEILFNFKKNILLKDNELLKNFIKDNENIIVLNYQINGKEPFLFFQNQAPVLTLNNIKIELEANIFLQATNKGQNEIIKIIRENLKECKNVADLYCGIGTYTFPLAIFSKVFAFEGSQKMINILNKNIKSNNFYNKIFAKSRDLVNSPLLKNELEKFDGIIINPPRNGAKAQCEFIAKSNIKKVIMVSCNPSTFSIDANILKSGDYELTKFYGIDQFYKTNHIEVAGVFLKNNSNQKRNH